MRISDWSSDVCSSDLLPEREVPRWRPAGENRLLAPPGIDLGLPQMGRWPGRYRRCRATGRRKERSMSTPARATDRRERAAAARLRRDGYAVVRGAMPTGLLDDAHIALRRDVLPYAGPLLRQNERREVNVVGPAGGLVNALIDIHREDAPQLRAHRR